MRLRSQTPAGCTSRLTPHAMPLIALRIRCRLPHIYRHNQLPGCHKSPATPHIYHSTHLPVAVNLPTKMQCSHITDERDCCGVPRISTNSPERARMGTDTVRVHPAMVPVNGEEPTASRITTNSPSNLPTTLSARPSTKNSSSYYLPTKMQCSHITDERPNNQKQSGRAGISVHC